MAAEDQFVIHHSMVLIVDTDSMKRSVEMKEWMKTTDMVLLPATVRCSFFHNKYKWKQTLSWTKDSHNAGNNRSQAELF